MSLTNNHPFINNKYTFTYFRIVARASGRTKSTGVIYERHHIIPESFFINRTRRGPSGTIPGNPNAHTNLVWLTPKEHFITHKLLIKMTHSVYRTKMVYALWLMTHTYKGAGPSINCRTYDLLRQQYATAVSQQFKGRRRSQNEIDKQIKTRREKGYKLSVDQIAAMQSGRLGKKWFTDGIENQYTHRCPEGFVAGYTMSTKQIANREKHKQRGRYKRDNAKRQKQSQIMTGRKWYNNGINNVLLHKCPPGFSNGRIKQNKQWYTDGVQNILVHSDPGSGWCKGFTSPPDVLERQRLGGAKGGTKCAGMKWWNDGITNYRSAVCPPGCVGGRLKFTHTKQRRATNSQPAGV